MAKSKYVSNEIRLSFVNVFEPDRNGKYSVVILMPKSDAEGKARMDALIEEVKREGAKSKWDGKIPPRVDIALHDGDGGRPSDGEPFGAECKGHWVISARSDHQPDMVDENLNPIINKTDLYSGCYARVGINPYAYNYQGKKGISFGLNTIQKLRDGEPLGGERAKASDDFGAPAGYTPPKATTELRFDPATGLPIRS